MVVAVATGVVVALLCDPKHAFVLGFVFQTMSPFLYCAPKYTLILILRSKPCFYSKAVFQTTSLLLVDVANHVYCVGGCIPNNVSSFVLCVTPYVPSWPVFQAMHHVLFYVPACPVSCKACTYSNVTAATTCTACDDGYAIVDGLCQGGLFVGLCNDLAATFQ